uniref:Craniofacial development protein 1 n=1 Tax=Denticeps clupeoides TaxID=299321 RepID=A0AAY4EP93_9TELE
MGKRRRCRRPVVILDDNLSEDDLNECVQEDGLDVEEQDQRQGDGVKTTKKKTAKALAARKRKKGALNLEEGGLEDGGNAEKPQGKETDKEEDACVVGGRRKEEVEKKKADDLWASFLSDVGPRPNSTAAPLTDSQQTSSKTTSDESSQASTEAQENQLNATEQSKITITKVFDFAGEEVRVTKEVDADSREAKSFLKKEEEPSLTPKSQPSHLTPGPSVKRSAGLGGLLNRIGGKKQKMSTLEKSRLDWDTFKTEEGIGDELAIHNRGKEGYVERKNFLERVDQRQFQLEKSVRLSNMKR